MDKKILAIICGGRSVEHEISLISAQNIFKAIDEDKFTVILIGVDKKNQFWLLDTKQPFLNSESPETIKLNLEKSELVVFLPGQSKVLMGVEDKSIRQVVDIVFPILHGALGEDGTIQGLLKISDIPVVGSDVLGSAIGLDKDVSKRLLKEAGIPVAKFLIFESEKQALVDWPEIVSKLDLPLFIKPVNTGSSVGINKVQNEPEFEKAVAEAFRYDKKIIVEQAINGREIECSILGNRQPTVSLPGEIIPKDKFYSYRAKYLDKDGAILKVPIELPKEITETIQELSIKAYKVLNSGGMARVDGFLTENGEYYINEINTIPGFTNISMYPKLWEASGLTYKELIDKLIQLAMERFEKEKKIVTNIKI